MSSSHRRSHMLERPPRRPRLMNTSRIEATPTRLAQSSRIDPWNLDQVQPMSRAAEQGWVFITCSPHRPQSRMEGRLPRMTLGQGPTCSFLSRSKYDVFPIMPGSIDTWCPRTGRDWVDVSGTSKAASTSKTCHRKGCAGECDKPQRRPHAPWTKGRLALARI